MKPLLRRPSLTLALLAAFAIGLAGVAVAQPREERPTPCATDTAYSVRGEIKAFGADRRSVNIAHEDIPGFMMAMTMTFQPRTPALLAGLSVGDRVQLTFTATADGQLLIDSIRAIPKK